ncbi:outer membrane beta-barrel protein [Ascidiimonas sp. W6]|uniref:outer membrane beta-barrel protein n=1 Tax=Ascidiimonas meishanensis TaxID=3128903 RepID=UPI0030EF7B86
MGEQKNIDRLFRERFKDLDVSPEDALWSKIESKLDEKPDKRRRVIPVWWRLGGIAAALALLFTLGYYFLSSNIDTQQLPVTDTKEKRDKTPENENKEKELFQLDKEQITAEEVVVEIDTLTNVSDTPKKEETVVISEKNNGEIPSPSKGQKREHVVEQTKETLKSNTHTTQKEELITVPHNKAEDAVVVESNNNIKTKEKELPLRQDRIKKKQTIIENKNIDAVVEHNNPEKTIKKDSLTSNKLPISNKEEQEAVIVNNQNLPEKNSTNNTIVENEKFKKQETQKTGVSDQNVLEKKTSIYDAIAEQEALKEKDVEETVNVAKWSVNPSIAPVYYNTLGEGSPIHSQFADNSKSGNINMSYGINVAYEISNRLSIRSGVNMVNYGYETDDIAITSQALQAAPIATIAYANTTANLRISDRPLNNTPNIADREINIEAPGVNGILTQELGYLEVPLELKYRLIDRKLGIHIIGGFSSLFLTDNAISVASDDLVTNIGEANNLNNTSFSTNIGFGLDYKLSDKILLNLEPIFKYQLNTFSNEDGGFRPYTIGVYTGLSFRF